MYEHIVPPSEFLKKKVVFRKSPIQQNFRQEVQEKVMEEWEAYSLAQIASGQQGHRWNSILMRFADVSVNDTEINIGYNFTDYKQAYGTNIKNPSFYHEYGEQVMANAIGACCLIELIDGNFLIFKRSLRVLELPGYYHVCGGHINIDESTNSLLPKFTIYKEIREELEIDESHFTKMSTLGFVRSLISFKPELLLSVKLNLDTSEIKSKPLNFEHSNMLFFSKVSLESFIINHRDQFVPSGLACIETLFNLYENAHYSS